MVAITRIVAISAFILAASASPAMIPARNLSSARNLSTTNSNITLIPSGRTVYTSYPTQYHNPADCGKGQTPEQTLECLEAANSTASHNGPFSSNKPTAHDGTDPSTLQPRVSRGEFFQCGAQTCVTPAICCGVDFGCRSFKDGCPGGSTRTGPPSMMDYEVDGEKPVEMPGMVCDKEGYCSSS